MPPHGHRIGDWTLDHATLRLSREGREHRLPRLQYDLLCVLLEHAGRLVPREALIERAWQRRVVGDEVLSRQIASLRQALEDDAREPRYIETVPKAGYRLLAPVVALEAPPPDPSPAAPAVPPSDPERVPRRVPAARWLLAIGLLAALAAGAWLLRASSAPVADWSAAAMARELPLASDPALESVPRLSRDGRWLAHARRGAAGRDTVYLARADGGGARALFEADGRVAGLAFAPDATALVFIDIGAVGCRVRRWTLPEGPLHALHACGPGGGIDWSPDGERLVFTAPEPGPSGAHGLLSLPAAGGPAQALTTPPAGAGFDAQPRWSADGTRLAFVRGASGEQQVFVAARGGTNAARLGVDERHRITALAWSASGRQLLVAMDPTGSPALFALDAASGARQWLGARGVASLDVAPVAGLVHEVRRFDANIWRHALDGSAPPRRLTPSTRFDAQPALAPDGQRVAYASTRDGAGAVWVVDGDGREARLPLPGDAIWTRPAWSPDGASLLLTHYVDGMPRAALHRLDSGATAILDPPDAAAAAFAGDGSMIAIVRADGAARLARWREGGRPVAIEGTAGVVEFRVGDRHLAWIRAGASRIEVAALDGAGPPREVAPAPLDAGAWAFAGASLAILAPGPEGAPPMLWRVDPDTGRADPVAALPAATAAGPSLVVSVDWRFALLATIDGVEADLWRVPPPAP
jgi:DNA-binding winged helix-turn-helix (wHTH) protein/Tol biopolymer transport system component